LNKKNGERESKKKKKKKEQETLKVRVRDGYTCPSCACSINPYTYRQ